MVLVKVVTKAVDSAPSANRSRNRLGMRKATVKVSISAPPNSAPQIASRASPSRRLHSTASVMIPAALVFRRSVRVSPDTFSAHGQTYFQHGTDHDQRDGRSANRL